MSSIYVDTDKFMTFKMILKRQLGMRTVEDI